MAMVSKTRNMLEGLVREGSFKWLIKNRTSFNEEFEEMRSSPSAGRNWIPELSPVANIVLRRCSKILGISVDELRENFDAEASDSTKHPSRYARNILEYCCFRALALSTQVVGYLEDKRFRRLTFDMMLAWEFPAASSQPLINMDEDVTVGVEAFSRIAPAVPIISNVIISDNLFEVLTASTDGRLQFSVYEKYLTGLERAIRKFKTQSESSLLSSLRSARGEKILEVDGTVTSQPVLEHVGISTWPGRLILTDHALYFEALRVVSYDKAKRYDLSEDLKQVVKPELTGPWGTRLFDKAVFYKSVSLYANFSLSLESDAFISSTCPFKRLYGQVPDYFFMFLRYNARLIAIAKGFIQAYGINYKENFAPVARMTMICTLISMLRCTNILCFSCIEVASSSKGYLLSHIKYAPLIFLMSLMTRPEPVVMEFPELKGHARRDYWLAIIREVLYTHRFLNKFQITGVERDEALLKATLGILRVQALKEMSIASPSCEDSLLMFNLCDQLPGGDLVLEALANMSSSRDLDRTTHSNAGGRMYSTSAISMASSLGFVFGTSSNVNEAGLCVGEITVGEISPLERAVAESRSNHKKVAFAKATVDGVKVDGVDTNLAVMKELLSPLTEVGKWLLSLAYWEDSLKSSMFCMVSSYIIFSFVFEPVVPLLDLLRPPTASPKTFLASMDIAGPPAASVSLLICFALFKLGWLGYAFAFMLIFMALFMVLTRSFGQGSVEELNVVVPPSMNTMEQLLAVQNAIAQTEELIQDGNIILLKFRALLLSIFPQASEKCAVALLFMALIIAFLPFKYIVLLVFLELFTKYSPLRKPSTERWTRRLREWWFSIPAAPVVLERSKEDKKRR
ncbi:hypothetical protein RHSIM_Rhsim08G0132600 [Rhododendron simsii]|uniref:DUF639 domain-containing protein n=1 Tax=Rhododendron simsii TaxID=118357 RepID=A0A834GGI6_RHOSS|nr:hypothetical protein RHSIM_Rhsim08G0132600 [Rhododendron simsii]